MLPNAVLIIDARVFIYAQRGWRASSCPSARHCQLRAGTQLVVRRHAVSINGARAIDLHAITEIGAAVAHLPRIDDLSLLGELCNVCQLGPIKWLGGSS